MKEFGSTKTTLLNFLKRYHLVVFVVITALLLSIGILLLSGIVGKSSGLDVPLQNSGAHGFDQDTINRIKQLKTSDQPSEPLNTSQRRINPFSE